MTAHSITWDHRWCDHGAGWFTTCDPTPTVHCSATSIGPAEADNTASWCRAHCTGNCELIRPCPNECDGYGHADPGELHDQEGHRFEVGECNVVLFLEGDGIEDCGPTDHPERRDGPITVTWEGEGYGWEYADAPAAETQGGEVG